ncbi:anti-sigma factor [Agrococcus sp. Marseille-P2731]|uniref:anti-sigma factor n=1 Tax=Agrococcus sp. Marseille-P2731 TaxID=1841862 RepID=UPI00190E93BE|nr:anti-sigma factor [Agrococcus sp. Marseille-P2731]
MSGDDTRPGGHGAGSGERGASDNDFETNGGDEMQDDQQAIDDLAAAYALDALSPEDRVRFEAQASPAARREAAELADTAALLAADEIAPPPSLRASILDAIRAEPQDRAPRHAETVDRGESAAPAAPALRAVPRQEPAATDASPVDASAPVTRQPGPAERRAQARWRPLRMLAGVAAGAALLAGGVAIGSQLTGDPQQQALGAVVAAADAQRAEVELDGGASATAIWSAELGQSVLLFDDLDAAPHGHAYQAWYIDEAGPHSAGVFDAEGASTAVLLEGEMDAGMAVGVTVEPEGGSEAPTTEPFLVVQT